MLTAEQIEMMRKIHRGEFFTVTAHATLPPWTTTGECGTLRLSAAGAEVLRLWEENAALRVELDEAALVLAAEQGRQEGAPSEGWRWSGAMWFCARTLMVVEPFERLWRINPDQGDAKVYPREPMGARAAMLAADKATI